MVLHLSQVLTLQELSQAIERGKIISGGQDLSQEVDEGSAIQTAWQAFEDGLYLVFMDDQQLHSLDEAVVLQAKSRFIFIRLVAFKPAGSVVPSGWRNHLWASKLCQSH